MPGTYLFDLHNHPRGRTHFHCAGEAQSIRQLLRVTQLEKGRAWIGTHHLALGRRKQTSTHTPEVGRYPTPHTAVSGIAHQYIFILLCWHHLAKTCTASMPSANLQLRTQPSDLTVVWLFPPPTTPFLGWFLLTAVCRRRCYRCYPGSQMRRSSERLNSLPTVT